MKLKAGTLALLLLCTGSAFALDHTAHKNQTNGGLYMDWLDGSVAPGDDFYAYANGSWKKNNPIPPEYSSWSNFNLINDRMQDIIHKMLIKAADDKHAKPGSIEQKVGDFYYSGMDEQTINQAGIAPLKPLFEQIQAIQSLADLQKVLIDLHKTGVDAIFGFGSMQDFKDSKAMIGALMQSGLGLPDRDYYLKDDAKFKTIRSAYVTHMARMFELLGDPRDKAAQEAQIVMRIETELAKVSMPLIEQRDPKAIYTMKKVKELNTSLANFAFANYFAALNQGSMKQVNLAMPAFFKAANKLLVTVPIDEWKIYLRWHVVDSFAPYLSRPFVDQNFRMTQVLTGAEKLLPRWKRVVSTESAALGFAIGKMYVDNYFSEQSRQQVLSILKNIRAALQKDLHTLAWMAPATRTAALKKLQLMEDRVGYPDKWRDYSSLKIDRGPYVLNVLRANEFLVARDWNKIGKPVDRSEWEMTPQTINAYYNGSMNNINLPAGILQPPFFDPDAPAAVNYGSIGFVIGHEITHGFDDQGAQFDGYGNLKNWWTPQDLAKFQQATQCISDQFSGYTVNGNYHVQGKLVVGEATADLGGIILAYRAFQDSDEYKNAKTIHGMTPDQQFFLGVAHTWASNMRPEQLHNQVTTDPHPPAQYRVNGSLSNVPAFRAAFNLPENSKMVNRKQCVIW